MKLKLIIGLVLFHFFVTSVQAQNAAVDVVRVIPPSPTAAAMAKYGEIPVSPYTGTANITIPLYEVTNRELSVPVVLSYHSGGIKVEDEASWVGLGWSLMSGGSITRLVRGKDDLSKTSIRGFPDSYLPASVDLSSYTYVEPTDQNQRDYDRSYLNNVLNGLDDTEPDIFVFNFNGRSGKFVLPKRTSPTMSLLPVLISQEDIKIEVSYSTQASNYQWTITDEKGCRYFFNTTETTISRSGNGDEEFYADANAPEGEPDEVVSTWYLDRVLSPTGAEIKFNYVSSYPAGLGTKRVLSRSQMKKHVKELSALNACTVPMNEFTYFSTYTEVHDVYLKEITFPNGKVEFKLSDRADIEPVAGGFPLTYAKKVDEVAISSGSGTSFTLLKKFIFNYSYFGAGASYAGKRLKLLSVTESNGTTNRPPYLFTYNEQELPNKDSKSIDHWGYYNGAPNASVNETKYGDKIFNGTLVPPVSLYFPQAGEWRDFAGADRKPNVNLAQACMLTAINYPTGGTTNFTYELNDYYRPKMEVIETPEEEYTEKFGPDTQVPNRQPETFTLEFANTTKVTVTTSTQCYGGKSCLDMGVEYEYDVANIKSADGGSFNQWIGYLLTYDNQDMGVSQETTIDLPAGKYQFTVYADQNYFSRLMVAWTVRTTVPVYNQPGAGLRVKSIVTYDGISHENDQTTSYSYTTTKEVPNCSTGKLMVNPVYEYESTTRKMCETQAIEIVAKATVRTSSPLIPFSDAAQGNPIGYDMVEITKGSMGKTVYEYLNKEDQISYPEFPNVPTTGFSGNGLLVRETIYAKNTDGTFKRVKAISKSYTIGAKRKTVRAMKVPSGDAANFIVHYGSIPFYNNVKFYDVVSEWLHPLTDTVKLFSQEDQNVAIQEITTYKYDNPTWLQMTEQTVKDSKGKLLTTTYKYPYDFSGTAPYTQMVTNHQIGYIIEKSDKAGAGHVQTIKTNYASWPNSQILPGSIDVKIGNGTNQTRIRNHTYSSDGLLLSQSKEYDQKLSYKWGYNGQYAIVEAANAAFDEFYYESFEEGTNIGVLQTAARTGTRVKTSGFVVNFSLPNQKPYILSYWYKTTASGTWLYKQVTYTGPSYTITDGAYIDEVRICPKDAGMKTYTYAPLVGMTSETDFSGKTVYYEYDAFSQLKLIKDSNGKILKQFDYQYQKPITQ